MSKNLIIVESPTKAKTISKFLGSRFKIESSYGHVRDLPEKEMGVNVNSDFKPYYVIPKESERRVEILKKIASKAPYVFFATDEDREGEAITWHLWSILSKYCPELEYKRITFHEITKEAILEALKNPREINQDLVNAQQARRILDRLVGYELSPFLWRKVARGLSAGRVQSPTLRLIVEREREIEKFKSEEYWTIEAEFEKEQRFIARLYKIDNKILDKLAIKSRDEAKKVTEDLEGARFLVVKINKKQGRRNPSPPFTTSTMQQEANRKLGFSTKKTMYLAQQLYEGIELGKAGSQGLITYMRTDSVNLSEKFLLQAQDFIKKEFGEEYILKIPRKFKTKSKLAQEAHEAIRPTEAARTPEEVKPFLDDNQFKLYDLIWRRALASQMKEAVTHSTIVDIEAEGLKLEKNYIFRATGSMIKFDGFLKIYPDKQKENILPELKENEVLNLIKLEKKQHFTQPASRYTEASLVKALEEWGIGRPSTYAPIIDTIEKRRYIKRENRHLKPTDIGFLVNDLLTQHFPKIVDYKFTAFLEDELDEIAQGKMKWVSVVKEFYQPFKANLDKKYQEISKKELINEKSEEICEKCGLEMVIKTGRFGKFLACTGFPRCKNTKPLPGKELSGAETEGQKAESKEPEEGSNLEVLSSELCKKCGAPLVLKKGRFGSFLSCSKFPKCKFIKNIEKTIGVKCPVCGKGEMIEKRTRKGGRIFYACNQYPNCKFALWSKPTGEKCQKCGSFLVYAGKGKIKCSNKECN